METKTIQSDRLSKSDLESVRIQVEEFLNSNFIIKNLVRSFPTSRKVIDYIPEIIEIVAISERGLEILEESGLLDAIKNNQSR